MAGKEHVKVRLECSGPRKKPNVAREVQERAVRGGTREVMWWEQLKWRLANHWRDFGSCSQ